MTGTVTKLEVKGTVNVEPDQLLENVRRNIRLPIAQFFPGEKQYTEVCIVGGGWSLDDPEVYRELCDLYHGGAKIIALNGAGRWCMERNLRPSGLVMVDARDTPENLRFLDIDIPHCRYLVASQVDPKVVDICQRQGDRLSLFHSVSSLESPIALELNAWYGKGRWVPIAACGFVGLTTLSLMANAGYLRQHIFGVDSCLNPDSGQHHAYEQTQNDGDMLVPVTVADREFLCSPWMLAQAQLFTGSYLKFLSGQAHLAFHGDGLLAHIIKTGASIQTKE